MFVLALYDAGRTLNRCCVRPRLTRRSRCGRLRRCKQAPDHPILWNVPETEYLKFYLFQVVLKGASNMASALESSLETSLANSLENVQNLQNLEKPGIRLLGPDGAVGAGFPAEAFGGGGHRGGGAFIGRILKKVCTKALEKANREVGMVSFISSAVSVIIKIFTAVIAISALGVDMSVIVGGLSAVGLGITLALKNNMANVASGLQMIFYEAV